ncbi:MAG: GGDEF domain-containing protein [Pseudomonadota bacterium]
MGLVETFSAKDVIAPDEDGAACGAAARETAGLPGRLNADEIAEIAREGQPIHRWPAVMREAYEGEMAERSERDQHFLFLLGLLVCLSTILIDMAVNPAMVIEGAILRVLTVAPITLLGLVAGAKGWRSIAAFCVGASPIAFAAVIVHLAMHLPPDTAARYLAAPALLMGFANLALPYSLRALLIFDCAYIITVTTVSLVTQPSTPTHNLDFVILMLIIAVGTIQLASRFEAMRQHNFLLTLGAKTSSVELLEANRQLRDLSNRDHLTGLANRRFFNRRFEELVEDCSCTDSGALDAQTRVVVMMIDLDHFKAFNDTHGHQAGDEALRIVGHEMAAIIEGADGIVARYGGEEFIVALCEDASAQSQANLQGKVERVSEGIRAKISSLPLPVGPSGRSLITTSIGIALAPPGVKPQREEMISLADEALYIAKRAGRNRIQSIEMEGQQSRSA